jgi:uncharacterized membrane protein YgdD (TMEM256/DUF423 family)
MLTGRQIAVTGAILSGCAVGLGAFGAHALKDVLTPERLETYKTAVSYLQWHALGLMAAGYLLATTKEKLFRIASMTIMVGMVFFSGSLFALVMTDIAVLGAITPIGGVLFILSWALIAAGLGKSL